MSDRPQEFGPELWEFAETWAESVSEVLQKITSEPYACQPKISTSNPSDTDLHISAMTAKGLRGELCFRLERAVALRLGQLLMGETPDDTKSFDSTYQDACEELFRQIAGAAAIRLKARWGEVQFNNQIGPAPCWPAAVKVLLVCEATPPVALELQVSAALSAALRVPNQSADGAGVESASPDFSGLLDVTVSAKLRFGTRLMPLRDILELSAGSVVELDRRVQEPVELLIDGKIAALGEVVVVAGNFGLRVTEVFLHS